MPPGANIYTPLLDNDTSFRYGETIYKGVSKKVCVTIEDVVDSACSVPSFSFIVALFGICTFLVVLPSVAYFPNFGGFLPYKEWKCDNSSEVCFRRTNILSDSGWKKPTKEDEKIPLEYRCLIDIHGLKTNNIDTTTSFPTIEIFENAYTKVGLLQFDLNRKDQQIKLVSYVNCENGEASCQKVFSVNFGHNLKNLECQVDFGHSTWVSKNVTITCNSAKVILNEEFGILPVIDKMNFIKLYDMKSYRIYCPDRKQYNRVNLCGAGNDFEMLRELELGSDFHWGRDAKQSFAIQWDLFCGREYLQTMVGSLYFCGGFVGALVGGFLLDNIGRKKGSLIGCLTVIVSTIATAAAPNISFLYVCRFIQGIGSQISVPGLTILFLEYVPQKYRAIGNSTLQVFWSMGYLFATLTGYLITDWHWLVATSGFLSAASIVPLLLIPESPRFLLVNKNNQESAKSSLRWLIRMNGSDYDIESVELDEPLGEGGSTKQTFAENMRDVWKYKALLVQIIIQMWVWSVIGFLYFGFSFSWAGFGENMYYSYMFAALAEFVAYVGMAIPTEYWGRKPSVITFLLVATVSCLVAMVPCNISDTFTLEQLCCLLASMLISASFGSIYLYTMELSPTSHRGKILGWCSLVCQCGASLGPQSSLLFNWNRKGTLALFAVLAGSAGLLVFRLPDTLGVLTPNTARDVQMTRDQKNIQADKESQCT